MIMNNRKTWFVTGASKGLGLTLVKKLLSQGYNVAATSRTVDALKEAVGTASVNFLALAMNLLDEQDIKAAIDQTVSRFGSVDVIVNNAGYGLMGGLEELSDMETRANFDINVFGSLNVIRQALPYMREKKNGHIFNISSIGGFNGGFPAFGIYCATKFAVHGFSESLSHEVKPFGINVTLVMPGYFRTNFLEEGSIVAPKNEIAEYENVREMQNAHQQDINNNQPGDPEKAADVLIAIAQQQDPALHLFLGADAYESAKAKIELIEKDMETFEHIATKTGFEN
jgi:NAD(P)-dependent dehydrogenase (short-subunit alcohol dehydrogenase family)